MRNLETIDAELRLIAALRRSSAESDYGPMPSIAFADALLDERNAVSPSVVSR